MPGYKHKGGYERSINMIGNRFDRLLVIEKADPFRSKTGKVVCAGWKCRCDCGNVVIVRANSLRMGKTKSCGCLNKEKPPNNIKHNMSNTRIYKIYKSMKKRCYNITCDKYKDYGGRGITVCEEWLHNFQSFYEWAMSNGYADDLTIDRKDVNGNYEPSNCRWIPKKEQAHNKRNTIYDENHISIAKQAREIGIVEPSIARSRYKAGWSSYESVHTPVLRKGLKHEESKKAY